MADAPIHFFISYTKADESWAEWIGWTLEEAGYRCKVQAWDFGPGSNFVLEMQNAAVQSERTLLVLSEDFLKSAFTAPEWAAAFASDPQGFRRKLLPVRIAPCHPDGLLAPIVYIDLVGLAEDAAQQKLLAGVPIGRRKPATKPSFPKGAAAASKPDFPSVPVPTLTPADILPSDLADRMTTRLSRSEVNVLWYHLFRTSMDNDMIGRTKPDCIIELLSRVEQDNTSALAKTLLAAIQMNFPHVLNP